MDRSRIKWGNILAVVLAVVAVIIIAVLLAYTRRDADENAPLERARSVVESYLGNNYTMIEYEGGKDDDGMYRYRFDVYLIGGRYLIFYKYPEDLTEETVSECVMMPYSEAYPDG